MSVIKVTAETTLLGRLAESINNGPVASLAAPSNFISLKISRDMLNRGYGLAKAYNDAARFGIISFEEPLNISEAISRNGCTKVGFPVPFDRSIGIAGLGLGLPQPCTEARCHSVIQSRSEGGFWIEISGVDKYGARQTSHLLISENGIGENSILKCRTNSQRKLELFYKKAKENSVVKIDPPFSMSDLITRRGGTQVSFITPNGESVGIKGLSLGLGTPCESPVLSEVSYDASERGYRLCLEAIVDGVPRKTQVLLSEKLRARSAFLKITESPSSDFHKKLAAFYTEAKLKGQIKFDPPTDLSEGISADGRLRHSFLCPNGEILGHNPCVGISNTAIDYKLTEMRYAPEVGGFWLQFCALKSGRIRTSELLISETKSGKQAILNTYSEQVLTESQSQLQALYLRAKEQKRITLDPPLDMSNCIASDGKTRPTLLCPNGETIGEQIRSGLGNKITRPLLHELRYSAAVGGYWMKLSAINSGQTVRSSILLSETLGQRQALVRILKHPRRTFVQMELLKAYSSARFQGNIKLDPPLNISEIVGAGGKTQDRFLCPNGRNIGQQGYGLGLCAPCFNPQLVEVQYDANERAYWLNLSATSASNEARSSWVQFSAELSGADAIITTQKIGQRKLHRAYQKARNEGGIVLDPSLDLSWSISKEGKLSAGFILPNGQEIGQRKWSAGLGGYCNNFSLIEVCYSAEEGAYWLTLQSTNKHNRLRQTQILFSEKHSGQDAILKVVNESEDPNLPAQFRQRLSWNKATAQLHSKLDEQDVGAKLIEDFSISRSINFLKGEAFEQLAGCILLSLYPNQSLVPQFCLEVDGSRGRFAMRADFRILEDTFEVKWGGATDNIIKTYAKHVAALGTAARYKLVMKERNPELSGGVSDCCLFASDLVSQSPLKTQLELMLVKLDQMVAAEDRDGLEALRDYLYSSLKTACIQPSNRRLGHLKDSLEFLTSPRRAEELRAVSDYKFQPLEAYFEFEGILYRSFLTIPVVQEENPERYSVLFRFAGQYFRQQIDRDIAVMLECGNIEGKALLLQQFLATSSDPHDHPRFRLPTGEVIAGSSQPECRQIIALEELRSLVSYQPGLFEFGLQYLKFHGSLA